MDAVDQVLAQRARRQAGALQGTGWMGLAAAVLLHLSLVAAALLAPRFEKPPQPFEFVPVQVVPAQALGVERPRGRPPTPTPPTPKEAAPSPPAVAPTTPPPPKPAAKPREETPEPAPRIDRRPPPPREKPKGAEPAPRPNPIDGRPAAREPPAASRGTIGPGGVADVGKGDEEGRRGSAAGSALGTSAFGSAIAGLEDPDFGYGYYVDRLLQLIDANWTRPPLGTGVKAVIYFRIQRGGAISDLKVAESSGYNSFDLAALRAVQNASPFPALPASYRRDSLGVNLIVR